MNILKEAMLIEGEISQLRRELHKNAETGLELEKTLRIAESYLEKIGCEWERCGRCGIVWTIGKDTGECVLIRADMDALEIKEQADIDFKSENGNMHACGHDLHTAMLLGAAKIIKKHEKELKIPVKFMLQGGEEILMGAQDMIKNGVLENPKAISGGMLHVLVKTPLKTGTVLIGGEGEISPYADFFRIELKGKGAHGAMSSEAKDTVNVMSHIIMALFQIPSKEIPLSEGLLITVGSVSAGKSYNVIPENACILGNVRSFSRDIQDYAKGRIVQISKRIASAFDVLAEVIFEGSAPPLKNDALLIKYAGECLKNVLDSSMVALANEYNEQTASPQKRGSNTGSEDFALISQKIPSVMLGIAAGSINDGYTNPLHSPLTAFDERVIPYGICAYVTLATQILPRVKEKEEGQAFLYQISET